MRKFLLLAGLGAMAFMLIAPPAFAQQEDSIQAPAEVPEDQAKAKVSQLEVEVIGCGTYVEDRELQGEATSFSKDIGKIYCWTLITGSEDSTTVEHVWYYKDGEMANVILDVKYPRVRTWSSKTILPEWVGEWRVDTVDANGEVIASIKFTVE